MARFYLGILGHRIDLTGLRIVPALLNGEPGVLVRGKFRDGRPMMSALAVTVDAGRSTAIYHQMNPMKLLVDDAL